MCLTAPVATDEGPEGGPDAPDAPAAGEPTFTLTQLAERSGLPARTIRWYQSEGLLPKPAKKGRDAVYRAEHLERLALIAELRDRGLTLVAIRDLVKQERLLADEVVRSLKAIGGYVEAMASTSPRRETGGWR